MSSLPPKKEYVLYAPLSLQQRELYDAIVKGGIRGYLTGNRAAAELDTTTSEEKTPRKTRAKRRTLIDYNVDGSDREYFERLERGDIKSVQEQWAEQEHANKTTEQLGAEHALKAKRTYPAIPMRPEADDVCSQEDQQLAPTERCHAASQGL